MEMGREQKRRNLHTYFQKTVNWVDAQNNFWLTFSNIEQLVIHQNEGVESINPQREGKSYFFETLERNHCTHSNSHKSEHYAQKTPHKLGHLKRSYHGSAHHSAVYH